MKQAFRYILFHKPYDVVSRFGEEPNRRTLRDFIPVSGVYPVGRLDRDSEGLLLLTNDGWLQHRLTDPRYEHPRTYWVQVEGIPTAEALERLRSGVEIRRYVTRPARARLLEADPPVAPRNPPIRYRASIPTAWLELTLIEGRNRQVRHMTAAVGFPTLRLVRAAIGPLRLEGIDPGGRRDAKPPELAQLRLDEPARRHSRY